MKNRILSVIIASLLISSTPHETQAISQDIATYGSMGIGVAAGLGTGALTYYSCNSLGNTTKAIVSVLAAATAGAISWKIVYYFLYKLTPQGRFIAAQKSLQLVELDSLISRNFDSMNEFSGYLNTRFGTNWSLILAKNHLITLSQHLSEARNLLINSDTEAKQDPQLGFLCEEISKLQTKIPYLAKSLEEKMTFVSQDPAFQEQAKLYEQHKEAARQRKHESWEKNMDRWHSSREKEKDRRLKQQALAQAGGRPRVNVNI